MRRSRALRDAQDKEEAQTVAGVLNDATVTITARAGAEGRLFGSVTTIDIADAAAGSDWCCHRSPKDPAPGVHQVARYPRRAGPLAPGGGCRGDGRGRRRRLSRAASGGRRPVSHPDARSAGATSRAAAHRQSYPQPPLLGSGVVHMVVHLEPTVVHLKFPGLHHSLPPGPVGEGRGTWLSLSKTHRSVGSTRSEHTFHPTTSTPRNRCWGRCCSHGMPSRRHLSVAWPRTSTSPPTVTCSRRSPPSTQGANRPTP